MVEIGEKILDLVCLLLRLPKAGGGCSLVAEVLLLRQQLIVLTRGKKKCPALTTADRLIMGLCTLVMTPKRIGKSAIAIAASPLLDFHRALTPGNILGFTRKNPRQSLDRKDQPKS